MFVAQPTAAAAPALPPLPALPAFAIPGFEMDARQQAAILAAVYDATGVLVQEVAGLVLGGAILAPGSSGPVPAPSPVTVPGGSPTAPPPFVAAPSGVGGSMLPVAAGSYRISSGFGGRNSPTGGGWQQHNGLDFAAPQGTAIVAVTGGTVVQAGDNRDGYGNTVRIKSGDTEVLYGHMVAGSQAVSVGDTVTPGQRLGAVGSTGNSTGPHLHFEVRRGGQAINPVGYLTALGLRA